MPDDPATPSRGNPSNEDPAKLASSDHPSGDTWRNPDQIPTVAADSYHAGMAAPRVEVIGDFEVIGKLGQGGMGAVYRARQVSLDRQVALKILPAQLEADPEYVARFQREARVAASLSHPNLVRVYASGAANGCHYIAMELIEGEALSQSVKRGAMPPLDALRIILDVTRALECGWRTAQLIHRDIKPGNIFLSEHGDVKLGDLGLAKIVGNDTTGLTQTGTAMGTPHYISPEQARGDKDLDFRADIYSLGCTLFQMLTGQTPYSGSEAMVVMSMHINAPPPAILKVMPQCPLPLGRLVSKMMKKQRRERHTSYEELIAAIESVLAQLDPALPPPSFPATFQHHAAPTMPVDTRVGEKRGSPLPSKSKTAVYGGVGVLVLAVAAFLLWPKQEKMTKAELYARDHAGERQADGATATPVSAESSPIATAADPKPAKLPDPAKWVPVFNTPESLAKIKGAEWTKDGIHLHDSLSVPGAIATDVALRAKIRPEKGITNLGLRFAGHSGRNAQLSSAFKLIRLEKGANQGSAKIANFPFETSATAAQEIELEFVAVGKVLMVWVDGKVIGSVVDDEEPVAGNVMVYSNGAYVREIAWQSLDGADATARLSPSAEPWQDVLHDPAQLGLAGGAERTPEGLRIPNDGSAMRHLDQGPLRDGAVRMRTTFGGAVPQLRARGVKNVGHYQLSAISEKAIQLNRYDSLAKQSAHLREFQLREPLQSGQDYDLELRVAGQTITVKLNGEILGEVTDGTLLRGPFGVGISGRNAAPALVKALEVLDLDALGGTTATATKDAPFVNTLGMKFVPVPIIGGPSAGQRVLFSVWDTRVQDYEAFVKETKREWSKPEFEQGPTHPAVNVSWEDAQAFCAWLTERERKAGKLGANEIYRLPTDHEWSCAVGVGDREDAAKLPFDKSGKIYNVYPWGTQWPPPQGAGNYAGEELRPAITTGKLGYIKGVIEGYNDGFVNTSPVGSFAVNQFGLYDISGNVWQWCEDWLEKEQKHHVLRGAAWEIPNQSYLLSTARGGEIPNRRYHTRGFRCVLGMSAP